MAQGDATDLFMKFVEYSPLQAIDGESTTDLTPPGSQQNDLLAGFKPRFMFEVDRFTFAAGLSDSSTQNTTPPANTAAQRGGSTTAPATPKSSTATPGSFQAWRSGVPGAKYPVDLQPVSFTRSIDKSSMKLIQHCIDCQPFHSASLIKRKAAGGATAGQVFLRLDFYGVLVIAVDWSNDSEVQETCKFICRSVGVSYCPQLPDGTLGGKKTSFWSMVPDAKQPKYA